MDRPSEEKEKEVKAAKIIAITTVAVVALCILTGYFADPIVDFLTQTLHIPLP